MQVQLLVNRLKLAATLTAPRCARVFVDHTLRSWLLPDDIVDDARVIVSELVTNSVEATGFAHPNPTYADLEDLALLAVQVRVSGQSLFIEVWDTGKPSPFPPPKKKLDESGWGLKIAFGLGKSYGHSTLGDDGQIVWVELDVGPEIAVIPQFKPTALPRGYRRVVFSEKRAPNAFARADLALMDRLTYVDNRRYRT